MFAVIETGGKQYKVSPKQKIKIEKISQKEKENFIFDKILLVENKEIQIGTPYIKGATVSGRVLKQGKDEKKIIFKYHSKTRYRKKKGHRQPFTEVEILDIKS
ncbi:MAG: 50S ribosomal protein L21 [Parcubacteria group bacterium]|nr:50S ribosomal protein L21 [Parcubacteria group bacterium]